MASSYTPIIDDGREARPAPCEVVVPFWVTCSGYVAVGAVFYFYTLGWSLLQTLCK